MNRLAIIGGAGTAPLLARLADDSDLVVAARALAALATLLDGSYQKLVAQSLRRRSVDDQERLVLVARDEVGARGLLALLSYLPSDAKDRWFRQKAIFNALAELHDPGAAEGLLRLAARAREPHYRFRAAAELAQLGDPRAVPFLAARLRKDPRELYGDSDWELALKRDDNERVVAARLIADLAVLHPDQVATFRAASETALLFWANDMPSPHANAMRALAALASERALPDLRAWAFPQVPLPKEGQQPPMAEEWVTAQSAQRYLGQLHDTPSFPALVANLKARPARIDVTMDRLFAGDIAILGMSLRALGTGAADGLSEWGHPNAVQPLFGYVRDPKNNEHSRLEACEALAWLADYDETARIIGDVLRAKAKAKADEFRRQCLLEGLAQRAAHVTGRRLLPLLQRELPHETRAAVARVIARAGIESAVLEKDLLTLAHDDVSGPDAVLALVLGGSAEGAVEAVQREVRDLEEPRRIIATGIMRALGFLSQEDLNGGFLFTVLRNADALAEAGYEWVQNACVHALDQVQYDNGPHSLTRVVLRYRLNEVAQLGNDAGRRHAIRALWYLRERGTLLALANSPIPEVELARTQYRELSKPAAPCKECPAASW